MYSYPNWLLLNQSGDTVANEQVNLFGIYGNYFHILDAFENLDYSTESFTMTAELWTGFSEVMACTYDLEVFPWMVDEVTDDPYGCIPIQIQIHGNSPESGTAAVSIANTVTDEAVFNATFDFTADEWVYEVMGEACLDQNSCYELYVNHDVDMSSFNININSGVVGGTSINYTSFSVPYIDSLNSVLLDPFGGDCITGIDEHAENVSVFPNPVVAGDQIQVSAIDGGELRWYSADGKLASSMVVVNGKVDVPNESGMWIMVWSKDGEKPKRSLVVVE